MVENLCDTQFQVTIANTWKPSQRRIKIINDVRWRKQRYGRTFVRNMDSANVYRSGKKNVSVRNPICDVSVRACGTHWSAIKADLPAHKKSDRKKEGLAFPFYFILWMLSRRIKGDWSWYTQITSLHQVVLRDRAGRCIQLCIWQLQQY